ncbi:MAG TPA: transglutaminase N-terminal domain-containing protein, partial [Steroidobacteraceae bacterium]
MNAACYAVRHETLYRYDRDVAHSHQQLHLTPRSFARQRCLQHGIEIQPQPAARSEHLDAFGNCVTRMELDQPHTRLQVVAVMNVSLEAPPETLAAPGEEWQRVREQLAYQARELEPDWLEAMRFRGESP